MERLLDGYKGQLEEIKTRKKAVMAAEGFVRAGSDREKVFERRTMLEEEEAGKVEEKERPALAGPVEVEHNYQAEGAVETEFNPEPSSIIHV